MTTILLIRHGRTDWLGKKLAGRLPGISLNEAGRAEAEELAVQLGTWKLDVLYASPLLRARETAAPLVERLGLPLHLADALQEVDFGELAGKTFDELKELRVWQDTHHQPSRTRFPGGESLVEVQRRCVDWTEQIRSQTEHGRIAAFSHADAIRLLLAHYLAMPLDAFHSLTIDPASVSILHFGKNAAHVLGINWPASAAGKPPTH